MANLRCIPNTVQIDVKIRMNQSISHRYHAWPGKVWQLTLSFLGDLGCCFSDNLDTVYKSVFQHAIMVEITSGAVA